MGERGEGQARSQLLALQPSSVARAWHTSSQEAVGALGAAQEDPGRGWPESQCDSHSAFSGQRSRRQPSLVTTGKKEEWER